SSRMAAVAIQPPGSRSSAARSGAMAGSSKTKRSSTTLVSITRAWPGMSGPRLAGGQVEAEQAAFDGAVPQRHAARFLEAHLAGQLEVGREQPGGPAGV